MMNSKRFLRAGRFQLFLAVMSVLLPVGWVSAQSRYSLNIAAYVDANFAAGSNFVTNPVNAEDNTVGHLLKDMPNGSLLTTWDPSTQSYGPTNVYNQPAGWSDPGATFNYPNGALLLLPAAKQVTFVGEVHGVSGLLSCINFGPYFTLSGVLPRAPCGSCYYYYSFSGGWVDGNFNPANPQIDPDESAFFFFPQSFAAAAPVGSPISHTNTQLGRARYNGSALAFDFSTSNTTAYALLGRTNASSAPWQVVQKGSATSTAGVVSISVPNATNKMGFYQMVGSFASSNAFFLYETRGDANFQGHFYAPVTANYELQRVLVLTNPVTQTWQTVATVSGVASNVVTVTDSTATASRGYYRLRY
jgi:hypothetical protein